MTETTAGIRRVARADIDRHEPFDSVMFSAHFIRMLLNDADRLDALERRVRELADAYDEHAERGVADRLRALLDEDINHD